MSGAPGSREEPRADEELLLALVEQLDRMEAPDEAELRQRFPHLEDRIQGLCSAARELRELTAALEPLPRPFEQGFELGDFTIDSLLASGGMGTVYRARQRSLGDRPVALKVLSVRGLDEPDRERFQREALAAASLHHPHLAEVYGFGDRDGVLFYGMELVEGPSLDDVLRERAGSAAVADERAARRRLVARVAEVARALEEVHAAGLVHRDVKPGNVVLRKRADGAESAVLVDFGLVRSPGSDRPEDLGTSSVTASYAPPEQLLVGEVDPRSDVFGLGASLHDLLARRLPQDRPRAAVGLEPIEELAPGIDADLAAILARAVDPVLEHRYADARAFREDLEAWLAGAPAAARRQGRVERGARWIRGHLRLTAAVGVAAALILLGSSWLVRARALARDAAGEYEGGDLHTVCARLDSIPDLLAWVITDPRLRDLRSDLRRDLTTPIPSVYSLLNKNPPGPALNQTAAYLQRDGLLASPFLGRFLRWALAHPSLRTEALRQMARLFYDRPDAVPDDVESSRPFRARLMEVLREDEGGEDHRWALSALSGCATLAEVPRIMEWASRLPRVPAHNEDRLLAVVAMERTIRRFTHPSDVWEAELDSTATFAGEAHDQLAELRSAGGDELADPDMRSAFADLVTAVVLFERARERQVDVEPLLDGCFLPMGEVYLRAAARDPVLAREGLSANPLVAMRRVQGSAGNLGEMCGLYGDSALTDSVREWVARDYGPDSPSAEDFHISFGRGDDRLRGLRSQFEADSRTVLRWSLQPMSAPLARECIRGSAPPEGVLAVWGFQEEQIIVSGTAESVEAPLDFFYSQGDSRENPEDDHWCLGPNRCTEILLGCRLDPDSAEQLLELEMDLLVGSRTFMPERGSIKLEVWVGDTWIGTRPVELHDYGSRHNVHDLPIPRGAFVGGEHAIRIRPIAGTAPCWFREVSLVTIE